VYRKHTDKLNADPGYLVHFVDLLSGLEGISVNGKLCFNMSDEYCNTVSALMDRNVEQFGDTLAVIYGTEQLSYGTLNELSLRVARGLVRLGIEPGDRVAFWLPNTIAYLVIYLACIRLGAIAVAVNTRYRSTEVSDIVARSGARAMVLWPGFRNIDFLAILSEIPIDALQCLETVILYEEGGNAAVPAVLSSKAQVAYQELLAFEPYDRDHSGPDVGCNIFTTSGTTRAPKFVLHRQAGIAWHAQAVWQNLASMVGECSLLQTLPFCGVFGFNQLTAALAGARPSVLQSAFDAGEAVALIDTHNVRYISANDDMVMALLAADPCKSALPKLICCGYGAFNMAPQAVSQQAEARGLKLVGLYGMSEVQALFARRDYALPAEERYLPGGKLISEQAQVRVRNPETGKLLGHCESGELELKGPSLMMEYFNNTDATLEAMTQDGFLRSGDLGYTTSADSFVFEARMGDTLRLGGFLVSPAEIESHLVDHPLINRVQVVAVRVGEAMKPYAFIIPATDVAVDAEAIALHCSRSLAPFKLPIAFHSLDGFPTTNSPNGTKIQRAKLREMAEAALRVEIL
jgi:fatty-acyl-CoA synthase